jgi:chorismate mutase
VNESLHKRLAELSLEIRNYPTPIARCDEQLAHLLDERSALALKINLLEEQGNCSPLALWINDGGFHAA